MARKRNGIDSTQTTGSNNAERRLTDREHTDGTLPDGDHAECFSSDGNNAFRRRNLPGLRRTTVRDVNQRQASDARVRHELSVAPPRRVEKTLPRSGRGLRHLIIDSGEEQVFHDTLL